MSITFKIHPAIGIARLGNYRPPNEPNADFYLVPESAGSLPVTCDGRTGLPHTGKHGEEITTSTFKNNGQIVRQAARFRIYAYHDDGTTNEVAIGDSITVINDTGQTVTGTLADVNWTAYLANKKAIWYEFQERDGEHGYGPDHPLRNASITNEDERRQMIIDPGPQSVGTPKTATADAVRASFARGKNGNHPQSFPPALNPNSIDTLGELYGTRDTNNYSRLLVLGGFGNSGSANTGLGVPKTSSYANNDGWFDDIADGPVTAALTINIETVDGEPDVGATTFSMNAAGAWVLTAYPAYLPQIKNIIQLDEAIYDMAVRQQACNPVIYGVPPFDHSDSNTPASEQEMRVWRETAYFNPDYYPYFWRDIWPILQRPEYLVNLLVFDPLLGAGPHQSSDPRNNFYPAPLSIPPSDAHDPAKNEFNRERRMAIYQVLRQPGQENQYQITPDPNTPDDQLRAMPELCGDNPISSSVPAKFLTLTRTMLFVLKQWADGKFINECEEGLVPCGDDGMPDEGYWSHAPTTPGELDRGVLSNGLGGAFCPGGEVTWIVRNPAIYSEPFRIRHNNNVTPGSLNLTPSQTIGPVDSQGQFVAPLLSGISHGLEPGDITKYNAVPWQTDFNECSTQNIDITYEDYNKTYPASTGDPFAQNIKTVWWWPTHRPMEVFLESGSQVAWSRGIPNAPTGDMMMVQAWSGLGFIVKKEANASASTPEYYESERNNPLVADRQEEDGS